MHRIRRGDVNILFSKQLTAASEIDFIHESGFIKIGLPLADVMLSGCTFFKVSAINYRASVSFCKGVLKFERNGYINELGIEGEFGSLIGVCFRWNPNQITCGYAFTAGINFQDHDSWFPTTTKDVDTPFTVVPASVFQAVLTDDSCDDGFYRSSEDLLRTLTKVLECIERGVHRHAAQRLLWRADGPVPEPEVTRFVGAQLTHYGNLLSFQVLTESRAGSGDTDFHITAHTRRGSRIEIALEGKYAHSQDLMDEVLRQLPSYMRALSADFGIILSTGCSVRGTNSLREL
jgi:hypothetical protein